MGSVAVEETIVTGMAGRYAQALFSLAKESGTIDQVASDLQRLREIYRESEDLQRFIGSPAFSSEIQVKVLNALLNKVEITGLAANFIKLVAFKRRLFGLPKMIDDFNHLRDVEYGIVRATVTSAAPLKDEQLETLKGVLAAQGGGKSVEIAAKVDPALIGGLIVQLGSRMVDGSLKTKLNAIRTRMKEVG
ncbi:F0F1 ATP synthase subunit delta [Beijerinckia indica]|uniref:ATP synthase subunit delta n=1 Tax=Beijerinckia indica subsp. indica (strain ATCC 9039 / DSM 1715 / NCIMB 8712) TaxID=395963 RepID=ATPD_BEII9|nr:F0F1 ATP synthase subunit delta [Beijerinckia indica]B2ICI8.1 RecName: Full=ATP synthase subunit delta; AltName: Full=ATP synthase F(1) sector subunit delta; AltName: Full=F-type ATPase subunit delta; Short=F-ATPase subunit delta [Beijerinckia indica subsp. indica ATCC 9039]ACB93877.1 ATP synthase F1, delta subunit [Beijerinckia indica subsp. indica ATCC 9039]